MSIYKQKIVKKTVFLLLLGGMICCLWLLPISCNSPNKVKKRIPQEKLAEMLADSYIIESMVYTMHPDSNRSLRAQILYAELFKKYDEDKDNFAQSITYYMQKKEQSCKLLAQASEALSKREDEFLEHKNRD